MGQLKVEAKASDTIYMTAYNAVWAIVRGAATCFSIDSTSANQNYACLAQYTGGSGYRVFRTSLAFDTSALPDNCRIDAARFGWKCDTYNTGGLSVQQGTQADTPTTADYNNFSGSTWGYATTVTANDWNEIELTDLTGINKTGDTKIMAREYLHDYVGTAPTIGYSQGMYFEESTDEPYLEIDYTEAHDLVAKSIDASAPVLDKPVLGLGHPLIAKSLSVTPVVDSPVIGQVHTLTARSLTVPPAVDSPAIGQTHTLTAKSISIPPAVDMPTLRQGHPLVAKSLYAGTPALDTPSLRQVEVYPDQPFTRDNYEIELIDSSLDTVGHLAEAVRPKFSWGCYGHGGGSLALHVESLYAATIRSAGQWYVRVWRNGEYVRAFMFSSDDWGVNTDTIGDEYIEITLQPLDMIASWRNCLPQTATGTFQTSSIPVDDGFKWIVDHAMGPNAYASPESASRVVSGVSVAANESEGGSEVISICHKMNLLDFLQKYGPTYDVDWQFTLDKSTGKSNTITFRTYYGGRGLDKTRSNYATRRPVVINDASGNIGSLRKYRRTGSMRNVVVADDLSTETTDATSISTYGRREIVASGSDSAGLDAALNEKAAQVGYEVDFIPSRLCQLGYHFVPGDTCTVGYQRQSLGPDDYMLKEAQLSFDANGVEQATLIFGVWERTLIDDVADAKGGAGGGGSGGGGGGGGFIDPIMGIKDHAETYVPFSGDPDYQFVWFKAAGGMTIVGDAENNAITFTGDPGYWDREGDGPGTLTQATAGDNLEIRNDEEVLMMMVAGGTGSTEWDGGAVFKQGGAGVWYTWPAAAPNYVNDVLSVASISGGAVGLQWATGVIMTQHLIIGEWHTADSGQTGYLKNTAGSLTWASLTHSHTISSESYHRHQIPSSSGTHTHTIAEDTHSHYLTTTTSETTSSEDHEHDYTHVTSYSSDDVATSSYAHDHSSPSGAGGDHNHTGYTGYVAAHTHTVNNAL